MNKRTKNLVVAIITVYCYCLLPLLSAQGTWTQKTNYGGPPTEKAMGFSIGTKGYCGLGTSNTLDFWEWDQTANAWTQKANFTGGTRSFGVGFAVGTTGYIGLGNGGQDFWKWDQTTNTWSPIANFPGAPRTGAFAWSISGKGYVGTGTSGGQELWEYDPILDSWIAKANFPGAALHWSAYFSIGTKGYMGTGYDGSNRQDFWEWDQPTNTWTQKTNFPFARRAAVGFSIGSEGYILLGYGSAYEIDCWKFDPAGNSWAQVTNFTGPASCCHVTYTIGSVAYVVTGYENGNGVSRMNYEYSPLSVSVNEINNEVSVSVYPNPFAGSLIVNSNAKGELKIFDVEGKVVFDTQITNAVSKIDLSDLRSGVYFYQLTSENKTIKTGKIIAQ